MSNFNNANDRPNRSNPRGGRDERGNRAAASGAGRDERGNRPPRDFAEAYPPVDGFADDQLQGDLEIDGEFEGDYEDVEEEDEDNFAGITDGDFGGSWDSTLANPTEASEGVRLQKVLAGAGVASRRVCEGLIVDGRVRVNGKVVRELGTRINPEVDEVTVNGNRVQLDTSKVYLALNKPFGVVSTMADEHGRPDLNEYVINYERVFNVGRLDAETTGLLLLTNDGDLANALAHPKFGVQKVYLALVEGEMTSETIDTLLEGFELEDGFIAADRARVLAISKGQSQVEIVLHSGRNRIVRRMLDEVGFPVVALVRKQFGPIHLGGLLSGHVRQLNKLEISELLKAASGEPKKEARNFVGSSNGRGPRGELKGAGAGKNVGKRLPKLEISKDGESGYGTGATGQSASAKEEFKRSGKRAAGWAKPKKKGR